jgi:hypothetical protein
MLADASSTSRPRRRLVRVVGTLSEGFSTARYPAALPHRVLLMGQQVWSYKSRQTVTYATCRSHPLEEPLHRHQAPPAREGIPERRLLRHGLGALGLVLPGLLRIKPWLTPLAAAGLAVVMVGAVAVTLASGDDAPAIFPLVVGLLVAFVAYGRWRLVPHPERQAATRRGAR